MQNKHLLGLIILLILINILNPLTIAFNLEQQPMIAISQSSGLMNSSWPMKCHDLRHTSRSPYSTENVSEIEKWRFKNDGWVEASAVIDNDGIIYYGSFDRNLNALYPDGKIKWKYHVDGEIWTAPALSETGIIYVGTWGRKLHAINPEGTQKWVINVGAVIQGSPAIAPNGTIYVSTMTEPPLGHSLIAINSNGTIRWRYLTGDDMTSDPAIGDDGTIYVGSQDTYLYAINSNGSLKWRYKTGDIISGNPAIADDGTIYISSYDGWLYALNPNNGSLIWKYTDGGDDANPAIGPDGIIYLGNSRLRAIFPNGTLKYSVDIGSDIGANSPTLSIDGTLYVGMGKSIVAVNAADGTKLWQKKIADMYVDSSPIIGPDGTVYIGSSSDTLKENGYYKSVGYLHAFGPVTSNSPPNTPGISGKPKGEAGEPQVYGLTSIDPDNNPVSFYIDWGDGSFTNWSGGGAPPMVMPECASGETVYFKHTYAEKGKYTIRAKARDTLGEESDWATLEVEMPLAQSYPALTWLLNRFPLIARLLELFTQDTTPAPETHTPAFIPESQQEHYDFMRMTYHDYQQRDTYTSTNLQNPLGRIE